ncbi:MAG: hypothetical protein WBI07_12035 [Mobilitalea sp.]
MYSDDWLRLGFQHGDRIKVTDIVDYVIWTDSRDNIVGVTVNFEEADDYHYDLTIEEWIKFIIKVLINSDFEKIPELFKIFLCENTEIFAFQDALEAHKIKFDKIAFS